MRSDQEYRAALALVELGYRDSEIGRRLGIPPRTVNDWRKALRAGSSGRTTASGHREVTCFRCTSRGLDGAAYAYLLGSYLGDGWLYRGPRGVFRLRITCDLKYPGIIKEVAENIVIVRGNESVAFAERIGCVDVYAYWKHWPCVFPQHGPGRKHERRIRLQPWQSRIIAADPKPLLRGLIHSDGNRHVNEVTRTLKSGPKRYRYARYMFTNASEDILGICTSALDSLGVHWTRTTPRDISVARRDDVSYLDTFIGPKH